MYYLSHPRGKRSSTVAERPDYYYSDALIIHIYLRDKTAEIYLPLFLNEAIHF